jgi:hypothetical protein
MDAMKSRDLTDRIDRANYFAENSQWFPAEIIFIEVLQSYMTGLRSKPIDVPIDAPELGYDTCRLCEIARGSFQDKELRRALIGHGPDAEKLDGLAVFSTGLSVGAWVISFYECKQFFPFLIEGGCQDGVLPGEHARSFFLTMTDLGGFTARELTHGNCKRVAWMISHIAWVRLNGLMGIYQDQQILDANSAPALFEVARIYCMALALNPSDPWILARMGEVYRNLANGWHAGRARDNSAYTQVLQYCAALCLFDESIRASCGRNDDFWACAHFGATVVNVRCFLASELDPGNSATKAVRETLTWLEKRNAGDTTDAGPLLTPERPLEELLKNLLERAVSRLQRAQEKQGYYYAWAEAYCGFATMLRAVYGKRDPEDLITTTAEVVDAALLQPNIFETSFEPGQLYVNPFYQFGLLLTWLDDLPRAWYYVRMGLQRSFDFNFIPGLEYLAGFQLLATISYGYIHHDHEHPSTRHLAFDHGPSFRAFGVLVPSRPFATREELLSFIADVLAGPVKRSLNPFVYGKHPLNTTIHLGLQCAVAILLDFYKLSHACDLERPSLHPHELKNSLRHYIQRILERMRQPDPSDLTSTIFEAAEVAALFKPKRLTADLCSSLFSVLNAGRPAFSLAHLMSLEKIQ